MNAQKQPAAAHTSLYVGNLDLSVNEEDLKKEFSKYGKVMSVYVVLDKETRQSRGYAYVNFSNAEEAEKALNAANFNVLKNKEMRVMYQLPKSAAKDNKGNIFVRNLPDNMDSKGLMDLFSRYGNILSCKVSFDNVTNKSLHYGYVHFADPAIAAKVVADMSKDVSEEGAIYVMPYEKHSKEVPEWTTCYVANFPSTMTKEDLAKIFSEFGNLTSVYVGFKKYKPDVIQGFVNFEKHEDAIKAVEGLKEYKMTAEDGKEMTMIVNRLQSREERERANQKKLKEKKSEEQERNRGRFIYIGFGNEEMDKEKLSALFTPFGVVETCSIAKDKNTHQPKPFGFVLMDTQDNATNAVNTLKSRSDLKLKIEFAQTRDERDKLLRDKRRTANSYMSGYPYTMSNTMMMPNMMNMTNNRSMNRKNIMSGQPMIAQPMIAQPMTMQRMMGQPMIAQPMMGQPMIAQPMIAQPDVDTESINRLMSAMANLPPITAGDIATMNAEDRRNTFGERIFSLISVLGDPRVSKITGMMLELSDDDLLAIVSDPTNLYSKIVEAHQVLDQAPN